MKMPVSLYRVVCFLQFSIVTTFLVLIIVSKIFIGKVLDYGGRETTPELQQYFRPLMFLQNCLWVVFVLWVILTLIEILAVRFNLKKRYIKLGLLGFLLSVLYFFMDPFGLIEYIVD